MGDDVDLTDDTGQDDVGVVAVVLLLVPHLFGAAERADHGVVEDADDRGEFFGIVTAGSAS